MTVEVFTVGFPRSGNTWIGHLLCAMLDAPLQNIAGEGMEKQWARTIRKEYVVRKTHWRRREMKPNGYLGAPVKSVWIYRDPRDVVVSRMFYNRAPSVKMILDQMTTPGYPFNDFVTEWYNDPPTFQLSYEQLHTEPVDVLTRLYVTVTGHPPPAGKVEDSLAMHEFKLNKKPNDHAMRKGIVGDWRNHFTREDAAALERHYGNMLRLLGYEKDDSWVSTV